MNTANVPPPVVDETPLTARQREILELAAKGLTNAEIADLLEIARGTVKVHMAAIYRVLDVTNRTEAAVMLSAFDKRAATLETREASPKAIVILPFDLMTSDQEYAHFADGLVEELITRLARWQWFPVIARQSAFAYKGSANDLSQVGKDLGARYAVEGSVRIANNRVRVTAQLIDTQTNTHLWADTYDGDLTDIFNIQDEVSLAIAGAVHPEVLRSQFQTARTKNPDNVDAWQLAMGAMALLDQRTEASGKQCIQLSKQALELDPQSLIATFALCMAHYNELAFQWGDNPLVSAQAVADYAARCMQLAPEDPYTSLADGTACLLRRDLATAVEQLRLATKNNPSSARAWSFLGQLVGMQGQPDEGIRYLQRAIELSPRDPSMYSILASIGICHFAAKRLDQACHFLRRAADLKGTETLIWSMLASASALAGWQDEATLALEELLRIQPEFSLEGFRRIGGSIKPEYLEQFEAGIRLAGLAPTG